MFFFENTRKPEGMGGKLMVSMMNMGHRALSDWGFQFLKLAETSQVLDCGCGGGANIEKLLKLCPKGRVCGIDYSPVSVEKSASRNESAIAAGRCQVLQASVAELPFGAEKFDLVTGFETVYFWPNLAESFREIHRVLKPGGMFFLCNECGGDNRKDEKWTRIVEGMTIYRDTELRGFMERAGFRQVQSHKNEKGWLCVTGLKSE